jgi:hypothetical protein
MSEPASIFDDYPPIVPGRITYATLRRIVDWRERHGLGGDVTLAMVDAYQKEGQTAPIAGLEMGLIDYGQASGWIEDEPPDTPEAT